MRGAILKEYSLVLDNVYIEVMKLFAAGGWGFMSSKLHRRSDTY